MKYSVIMPVFLGDYSTRGTNPSDKFKRAVNSFLLQEYKDTELMIISDGCDLTESIFNEFFLSYPNVHFHKIIRETSFGGRARQTGIEMSQGELICYLDHDDMFGPNHIKIINENFDKDWVYYDDYIMLNIEHTESYKRDNIIEVGRIGSSSIVHKRSLNVQWGDGYGHDWFMIEKYLLPHPCIKIPTPEYYVCHTPESNIDY